MIVLVQPTPAFKEQVYDLVTPSGNIYPKKKQNKQI